jgi:hypothetical protein
MTKRLEDHEVDKLVGEHVMGWTFVPGPEGSWYDIAVLVATEDWSPSTDIRDAWQVVQHIKQQRMGPEDKHPIFALEDESEGKKQFFWAYFAIWVDGKYGGSDQIKRHESYSTTPGRAICFAALRLVGNLEPNKADRFD